MDVIVFENGATGDETVWVGSATKNQSLSYVVPYLMVYGAPGGSVTMQLQDSNGSKIADSQTVSIATILGSDAVYHGWYAFSISATVKRGQSYRVEMVTSGGYSYSQSTFIGWCNSWERQNRFPATYNPTMGLDAPLGIDFWGYEFFKKGDF